MIAKAVFKVLNYSTYGHDYHPSVKVRKVLRLESNIKMWEFKTLPTNKLGYKSTDRALVGWRIAVFVKRKLVKIISQRFINIKYNILKYI